MLTRSMLDPFSKLISLRSSQCGEVLVTAEVSTHIALLDEKQRQRLLSIMEKALEVGSRLPPEQLKVEGRFKTGDARATEVQIYAFKLWGFRVYAGEVHYKGRRTFVCTACDPAKKQQKADPALLDAAAKGMRPFVDFIREGKKHGSHS